jgi:hypothetical protein
MLRWSCPANNAGFERDRGAVKEARRSGRDAKSSIAWASVFCPNLDEHTMIDALARARVPP